MREKSTDCYTLAMDKIVSLHTLLIWYFFVLLIVPCIFIMAILLVDAPWNVRRLVKTSSWVQRNHSLLRNWGGKCVKCENRCWQKYAWLTSLYDESTRELRTSAAASWCRFRCITLLNFLHWRWKKLLKLLVLAAGTYDGTACTTVYSNLYFGRSRIRVWRCCLLKLVWDEMVLSFSFEDRGLSNFTEHVGLISEWHFTYVKIFEAKVNLHNIRAKKD
jgi:hypothetical protein